MGKQDFIEMDIFKLITEYKTIATHIADYKRKEYVEVKNDTTLTTLRGIIVDRYKHKLSPELNFSQQCFVKCKIKDLHLLKEDLL